MFKRMGLGITCLALAYSAYCGSGYCRAGVINTCGGDDKNVCKDDSHGCKVDFKTDDKDCKDILKDLKGDKECEIQKGCKFDQKGYELVCLETWIKDHGHSDCKVPPKGDCNPEPCQPSGNDGGCHPAPPCGDNNGCGDTGCGGGSPCASVPAPAASMMSGFGLLGVIFAGWIKSRRNAKSYC